MSCVMLEKISVDTGCLRNMMSDLQRNSCMFSFMPAGPQSRRIHWFSTLFSYDNQL